ncbi:hypothetical protein, partial [Escherichia coli]|uniref:hypothetical protein n=1 Tax=Escherichia coli TaxID=562 RepID=UPI0033350842
GAKDENTGAGLCRSRLVVQERLGHYMTTMSCSSGTSLKQVIIFMISPVSRIRNHLRWKVKMA